MSSESPASNKPTPSPPQADHNQAITLIIDVFGNPAEWERLKGHPVVFTPNRLGDAGVRSEYPGSLVPDQSAARPLLDGLVGLLVNLDREDVRRFFYTHAWGVLVQTAKGDWR